MSPVATLLFHCVNSLKSTGKHNAMPMINCHVTIIFRARHETMSTIISMAAV